ncbi:hypothetical protein HK098_006175 [Nowakowskiella sp. JEL0407]|nr:hypothetical protein HK098_006175 [Nowakowskiella sp. JEL0407]
MLQSTDSENLDTTDQVHDQLQRTNTISHDSVPSCESANDSDHLLNSHSNSSSTDTRKLEDKLTVVGKCHIGFRDQLELPRKLKAPSKELEDWWANAKRDSKQDRLSILEPIIPDSITDQDDLRPKIQEQIFQWKDSLSNSSTSTYEQQQSQSQRNRGSVARNSRVGNRLFVLNSKQPDTTAPLYAPLFSDDSGKKPQRIPSPPPFPDIATLRRYSLKQKEAGKKVESDHGKSGSCSSDFSSVSETSYDKQIADIFRKFDEDILKRPLTPPNYARERINPPIQRLSGLKIPENKSSAKSIVDATTSPTASSSKSPVLSNSEKTKAPNTSHTISRTGKQPQLNETKSLITYQREIESVNRELRRLENELERRSSFNSPEVFRTTTNTDSTVVNLPSRSEFSRSDVFVRPITSRPPDRYFEEPEEPNPRYWALWRVWLGLKFTAVSIMFGFNVYALVHDGKNGPCDVRIYQFLTAHGIFLGIQALSSLGLLIGLPYQSRRWDWANFLRVRSSLVLWIVSSIALVAQIAMVPIGFAFLKNAIPNCIDEPSVSYEVAYYCLILQASVFVFIGLPSFCVPCIMLFASVPERHGVSTSRINRFPTIIYTTESTETSETSTSPNESNSWLNRIIRQRATASTSAIEQSREILAICDKCAICQEAWEQGAEIKKLDCKHAFHDSCIRVWFELHSEW